MAEQGGGDLYDKAISVYGIQVSKAGQRQAARSAAELSYRLRQLLGFQRTLAAQDAALIEDQRRTEEVYGPIFRAPGTVLLDVPPPPGREEAPINYKAAKALGLTFKNRKAFRRFARDYAAPGATQVSVARVGLNNPVLRGSRDDPAGPIRPIF
jgi:hypothetical protein